MDTTSGFVAGQGEVSENDSEPVPRKVPELERLRHVREVSEEDDGALRSQKKAKRVCADQGWENL